MLKPHAQAKLGVVLEQRVGPGWSAAIRVGRVGGGRQVAAVNRGAAGGVGDHETVAVELGQQLEIRRLAAAGTGAEYSNRGSRNCELLTSTVLDPLSRRIGDAQEQVVVGLSASRTGASGSMLMAFAWDCSCPWPDRP